jgi:hypothetical protein
VLQDMSRGGDAAGDLDALQVARSLEQWVEVVVRAARPQDERPMRLREGLYVVERSGPG